jgi:hypothetical protein
MSFSVAVPVVARLIQQSAAAALVSLHSSIMHIKMYAAHSALFTRRRIANKRRSSSATRVSTSTRSAEHHPISWNHVCANTTPSLPPQTNAKQKYSAVPLPRVDGFALARDLSGGICSAAAALQQAIKACVCVAASQWRAPRLPTLIFHVFFPHRNTNSRVNSARVLNNQQGIVHARTCLIYESRLQILFYIASAVDPFDAGSLIGKACVNYVQMFTLSIKWF